MVKHQEHFGKSFYQDLKNGYWISTDHPRIRAHRWVWNSIHGAIPKGYHIHHKDEDKSNNDIQNLELIEMSRHFSIHMQCPIKRKRASEHCNSIRPLTKEWHQSEEGRAWHRLHALQGKFGKWEKEDVICDQCHQTYQRQKHTRGRFCSNKCKSQWRRLSGIDDIERACELCLESFKVNKYSKIKYCSNACGRKSRLKLQ